MPAVAAEHRSEQQVLKGGGLTGDAWSPTSAYGTTPYRVTVPDLCLRHYPLRCSCYAAKSAVPFEMIMVNWPDGPKANALIGSEIHYPVHGPRRETVYIRKAFCAKDARLSRLHRFLSSLSIPGKIFWSTVLRCHLRSCCHCMHVRHNDMHSGPVSGARRPRAGMTVVRWNPPPCICTQRELARGAHI